ncbi:MAG: hypothetical protein R2764_00900 [Bacteroidales bacterium]
MICRNGLDKEISIAFESYNYFGNNLYIDNVSIGLLTDIYSNSLKNEISLFPNPTTGRVNAILPKGDFESVISVVNMQGVEVGHFIYGSADNSSVLI